MSQRSARPGRAPKRGGRAHVAPLGLTLLGSFGARVAGAEIGGFESRNVRAILAYLALQESRPVARDQLGTLFWTQAESNAARQNLRQAIYNLREVLGGAAECLLSDPHEVRLDLTSVDLDVSRFSAAAHRGLEGRGPASIEALATALESYGGELLLGLHSRGAEGFEEWRTGEAERLRELAMECAREALRRSEADGLHESALRFARRLLDLDPLSEEACGACMRLLSRLGRRAQALRTHERFATGLRSELDLGPSEELEMLRATIAANQEVPESDAGRPGPSGPVVPLVGRESAWRELSSVWSEVRDGECRITLITGPRGSGKSRLVRTFVYRVLAGGAGTVLLARAGRAGRAALPAILAEATASLPVELSEATTPRLRTAVARAVSALPEVRSLRRDLPQDEEAIPLGPLPVFADLLRELSRSQQPLRPGRGAPVVLFIDDLERSPEALDGLLELRRSVGRAPIWILAAARSNELTGETLESFCSSVAADGGRCIGLGDLEREDVDEAALALVGKQDAGTLATGLFEAAQGSPLALAEAVNLLADRDALRPERGGGWSLATPEPLSTLLPVGPAGLIDRRLELLPNTSRRLLGLAAVIGERFDTATLLEVDREHPAVLEVAMQILIERWMVRPLLRSWAAHRRDRDLTIWQAGGRRGPFEFAHRTMRDRIVASIDPERRRVLEAEIGRVRETSQSAGFEGTVLR